MLKWVGSSVKWRFFKPGKMLSDFQDIAQSKFEESRTTFRSIAKTTFDHTALFSVGPAKPVTVIVPAKNHWEGLSIDRCNLKKPGLSAIEVGKVSPSANGSYLTSHLVPLLRSGECFVRKSLTMALALPKVEDCPHITGFLGGRRWTPPPSPVTMHLGLLSNPNLLN